MDAYDSSFHQQSRFKREQESTPLSCDPRLVPAIRVIMKEVVGKTPLTLNYTVVPEYLHRAISSRMDGKLRARFQERRRK